MPIETRDMKSRHLPAIRILHLEDDALDAQLIKAALQVHLPCDITAVASKAAFQAELELAMPDFIISDSSLPGFDGLAALQLTAQKCPKVPFIFCSGYVSAEKKREALAHGAMECIPKDDLDELIALIKRLREPEPNR